MGLFDTIIADVTCPKCGVTKGYELQTKDIGEPAMRIFRPYDLIPQLLGQDRELETIASCYDCPGWAGVSGSTADTTDGAGGIRAHWWNVTVHVRQGVIVPPGREPPDPQGTHAIVRFLLEALQAQTMRALAMELGLRIVKVGPYLLGTEGEDS